MWPREAGPWGPSQVITVRMPTDVLKRLDAVPRPQFVSRVDIVRQAILACVKKHSGS